MIRGLFDSVRGLFIEGPRPRATNRCGWSGDVELLCGVESSAQVVVGCEKCGKTFGEATATCENHLRSLHAEAGTAEERTLCDVCNKRVNLKVVEIIDIREE